MLPGGEFPDAQGHYWKESFSTTLADAVRANLKQLSETHPDRGGQRLRSSLGVSVSSPCCQSSAALSFQDLKLLLILLNDKNDREASDGKGRPPVWAL